MNIKRYIILCLFVAVIGYLLRISIDSYTKQGKYKDPNEPTHFEKQLALQKNLHNQSNENSKEED